MYDTLALVKAGYIDVSTMLSLYDTFRNEKECMYQLLRTFTPLTACLSDLVWRSIADSLSSLSSTWYEYPDIVEKLDVFRRVGAVFWSSYN